MPQAYLPDGTPISDDQLPTALASGQAQFYADDVVTMRDANGDLQKVKGSSAHNALKEGWTVESDAERQLREYGEKSGLAEGVQTFAEHAASGLTIGASDAVLAAALGEDYRKERKLREKTFEGSALAGDVAAVALPFVGELGAAGLAGKVGTVAEAATVIPRGVSGLARGVGKLAGEGGGVLRTGARYALEGATEGAVYGAGQTVSEAALGDHELTAERLLAGAADGALVGGALGGAMGLAGAAVSKGASKLVEKAGKLDLESFANKKALQASGALGGDLNKITEQWGPDRINRIGKRLRDAGIVENVTDSLPQRLKKIEAATSRAGAEVGEAVKAADSVGAANADRVFKKLDEFVGSLRNGMGDDARMARRIERDYLDKLREKVAPSSRVEYKVKRPDGTIETKIREATTPEIKFSDLHEFRKKLDDAISRKDFVDQKNLAPFRRQVKEALEEEMASLGGDTATKFKAANEAFSDLVQVRTIAKKRTGQAAGNRSISLTDYISTGAAVAAGGPAGLAMLGVNKAVREYGDAAAVKAVDVIRKVRDEADKVAIRTRDAARAAVKGDPSLGERLGRQGRAAAVKLATLYDQRSKSVSDWESSRDRGVEAIAKSAEHLTKTAPGLAKHVIAKQTQAQEYLASQLPRAAKTHTGVMGAVKQIRPSDAEMQKFLRKARAVDDPSTLLTDLSEGSLTRDAVAAVEATAPRYLESMRAEVREAVVEEVKNGRVPPYQTRLRLEIFLGGPVDSTGDPAFVKAIQAVHAAMNAPAQAQGGGGSSTISSASDKMQETGQRAASGVERLESGGA